MLIERFYDEKLAQASYLVGCQASGDAIVIDAARDVQPYLERAAAQGLKIVMATETHIHADYLSGTRELAHRTGAQMLLSDEGTPDWKYQFARPQDRLLKDKDVIKVGNLTLQVMHSPGHTPEHISFVLTDPPASPEPVGIFSGDFLFVGDVGRPDLLERAAGYKDTMRAGAATLYRSIQRLKEMPGHLQIWPAHGAGSACGKALGAVAQSVLAYERTSNWALKIDNEEQFIEEILAGQPEPPRYFAQMKKLNKEGPPLLQGRKTPKLAQQELEEVLKRGDALLDLRGAEAYAAGHARGSLFLPAGNAFVNWAGWLLPYDKPIYVLSDKPHAFIKGLQSIGLDQVEGYFLPQDLQVPLVESKRLKAEEVRGTMFDVRSQKEWNEGHMPGARHFFLGDLPQHMDELPENPIFYCGSGMRSLIAASLVEKHGKEARDVIGGYAALRKVATPV